VTKQKILSFETETNQLVQISHCNKNYWICVSNVGCKPEIVVFDSMRTGDVSIDMKEPIASILHTSVGIP